MANFIFGEIPFDEFIIIRVLKMQIIFDISAHKKYLGFIYNFCLVSAYNTDADCYLFECFTVITTSTVKDYIIYREHRIRTFSGARALVLSA